MIGIIQRLYISLFYLSFLAVPIGGYQIFKSLSETYQDRALVYKDIAFLKDKLSKFPLENVNAQGKSVFNPDKFLIELDLECYQSIVNNGWDVPYDKCESVNKRLNAGSTGYYSLSNFYSLHHNLGELLGLFIFVLFPFWIFLIKSWVVWIVKGKIS